MIVFLNVLHCIHFIRLLSTIWFN